MQEKKLTVGATYQSVVEATVVGDFDVIVVGGGTAGVVAAIAAARNGAKVLMIERSGCLGGMMTGGNAGLTTYIAHAHDAEKNRELVETLNRDPSSVQIVGGIPMEITKRLMGTKAAIGTNGLAGTYVFTAPEDFKLLLLSMMEEAGVELMLHSLLVDTIKSQNTIEGVVFENKSGRQIVSARMFIDTTGDGDLAAKTGAPFAAGVSETDLSAKHGVPIGSMQPMGVMFRVGNVYIEKSFDYLDKHPEHFGIQGCAMMTSAEVRHDFDKGNMVTFRITGLAGTTTGRVGKTRTIQIYNTPLPGVFTCCCPMHKGNGLDVDDLTNAEIAMAKLVHRWVVEMRESIPGFEEMYLLDCPEIGVRETRHFEGEYVLNFEDIYTKRDFKDTIGRGSHHIDISPLPEGLAEKAYDKGNWYFNIPYRCLVPKHVDNLLLAGRCISNTHEASGCTRPTTPCMITGEAAGTAAAMCVKGNTRPVDLDTDQLRKALSDQGVIL